MVQDPTPGPLGRFMRFTTQKEPVLSAAVVAAFLLYLVTRVVPGLTDDDLQLIALVLVPIVPALLARLKAWSPIAVAKAVGDAYDDGVRDGERVATPKPAEKPPVRWGAGRAAVPKDDTP